MLQEIKPRTRPPIWLRAWLKVKVGKQELETGLEEEEILYVCFPIPIKSSPGPKGQRAWEVN